MSESQHSRKKICKYSVGNGTQTACTINDWKALFHVTCYSKFSFFTFWMEANDVSSFT